MIDPQTTIIEDMTKMSTTELLQLTVNEVIRGGADPAALADDLARVAG